MIDLNANEATIMSDIINEPIKECTLELYNHFGRYYYAAKALDIQKSDVIIDSSCAVGYGSYSIAQLAYHVFGLDINKDYIKMAKTNYAADNITFSTYDYFYKSFPVQADKILCIETLEHVPKEDINNFITKLLSKLASNGSMFVTVPLGNNEPSSYNKWHLHEPNLQFIYDIFYYYFKNINIEINSYINSFHQSCQYCYLILKNKF